MIIAVTGGRDYDNVSLVEDTLNHIHDMTPITLLVHGSAKGADYLAARWATLHLINQVPFQANWDKHGKSAGPKRNALMLSYPNIELLISFPGGRGTQDCTNRAIALGIRVIKIPEGK